MTLGKACLMVNCVHSGHRSNLTNECRITRTLSRAKHEGGIEFLSLQPALALFLARIGLRCARTTGTYCLYLAVSEATAKLFVL